LIAPIFPRFVQEPENPDGYKYLFEEGLAYPDILLAMINEAAASAPIDSGRLALFGFSGGGQFAHRFLLANPRKVFAASIAAPGSVTLIDDGRPWWVGTRDFAEHFGNTLDRRALTNLPVQIIVGDADLETDAMTHRPGGRYFMEGANSAGITRVDRARTLAQNFAAAGMRCQLDIIHGAGHELAALAHTAHTFLSRIFSNGSFRGRTE
jgi:dienelactone hydrolase